MLIADSVTWVEEYGDMLFGYAIARVGDVATAEDLVQETLLAGLEGASRFSGLSSVGTWLTGILRHKIIDHYRHSSFLIDVDEDDDLFGSDAHWRDAAAPGTWDKRTPEDELENKQLACVLQSALSVIPKRLAVVFAMREIAGLDRREICELLCLTDANYWVMLHRARLRLRHEVELRWTSDEVATLNAKLTPALQAA